MEKDINQDIYDFGYRLQFLRKNRGLTQKEVAARLEMNPNTIAKYESNLLTPSVEVLIKLALIYNSSTDYILGLSNRTKLHLDDFSVSQQQFIVSMVGQARAIFIEGKSMEVIQKTEN